MAGGASCSSGKKKKKKKTSILGPLVRCFAGHHKERGDEKERVQEEEQAAPNIKAAEEQASNLEVAQEKAPVPSPSVPAAASVPGPSNAAAAVAETVTSSATAAGDGAPAEASSAPPQPAGKKVLLVDSEESRMTGLENALRDLNPLLHVDSFQQYDRRILKIKHNFYDLVIVCHALPDMDGSVMTWLLRGHVQMTCPIIVLSMMHKIDAVPFFQSGANEFIHAPIGTEGLRALLVRHRLLEPEPPPDP